MAKNRPSETKSSKDDVENKLYSKRKKLYPREVHGLFAFWRTTAVITLLGAYYLLPWLQWDERQAILFDLPARKFYILGLTFWPQDFIYLAGLLVIAALSLFFFTALAGRLWCGYACPQTVWTEAFLWIERKVEGSRPKQMKLDKMPWSAKKLRIKGTKHFFWIAFSLWTGFTFVGYFTPIIELWHRISVFQVGVWEAFWVVFYGFATYGNAGWLREQVCTYMCPYARFQSAMIDKNTLVISYDQKRGDPRGGRRRRDDLSEKNLGHCIDCSICVQVCPTGIDIRDGLQYQCIGCAACIDACDDVMDKMNYPKGLVRYTTENQLDGKGADFLRPRIIIYALILIGISLGILYSVITRPPLSLDVIRDRSSLYRESYEGLIENVYTLKLLNKDNTAHQFSLNASGVAGIKLLIDEKIIKVEAGHAHELSARIQVDPKNLSTRSIGVKVQLQVIDDPSLLVEEEVRFIGPNPNLYD